MTIKAYRGTKLSEAVKIMTGHMPEKYSYRITDPGEALGYADIASTKDRSMK